MVKEYRIMAIFKKDQSIYQDRSYKRKVVTSLTDAENLLHEASEYYQGVPYQKYIDHIEIQFREVSDWTVNS